MGLMKTLEEQYYLLVTYKFQFQHVIFFVNCTETYNLYFIEDRSYNYQVVKSVEIAN
jgi:hypothetical protein